MSAKSRPPAPKNPKPPMPEPPYDIPPFPPPGYPPPSYSPVYGPKLPAYVADKLMPTIPFYYRPLALKAAIALIIAGVVLCLGFVLLILPSVAYSSFSIMFVSLFLIIGILGVISIVLLMIPKRVGWYFGMVTAIMGLLGLGPGTLISIFVIIALLWPSTLYYFRTGQPLPAPLFQYPYPEYPPPYPPPYPFPYPPQQPPPYPYPGQRIPKKRS
ncbi:hypothetical protein [[Eubacterium] cellulosolvens]